MGQSRLKNQRKLQDVSFTGDISQRRPVSRVKCQSLYHQFNNEHGNEKNGAMRRLPHGAIGTVKVTRLLVNGFCRVFIFDRGIFEREVNVLNDF
jgi:hypothetical protein